MRRPLNNTENGGAWIVGWADSILGRWLSLQADGVIAYSEHARNYYIEEGFAADKVWVAPNSPDTRALLRYRDEWLTRAQELQRERNDFPPGGTRLFSCWAA